MPRKNATFQSTGRFAWLPSSAVENHEMNSRAGTDVAEERDADLGNVNNSPRACVQLGSL